MLEIYCGSWVTGGGGVPQDFWGAIFSALHFPQNLQWAVEEMALGDLQFTNEHLLSVSIP